MPKKLLVPEQGRMHVLDRLNERFLIRVKHYPERTLESGRVVKPGRYVLRCGDCSNSLEIQYRKNFLEINGVDGSIENWRKIFLPLLDIDPKTIPVEDQKKAQRTLKKLRAKYPRSRA